MPPPDVVTVMVKNVTSISPLPPILRCYMKGTRDRHPRLTDAESKECTVGQKDNLRTGGRMNGRRTSQISYLFICVPMAHVRQMSVALYCGPTSADP